MLEDTGFYNASLYTPSAIAGIETLGWEIAQQCRSQLGRDPDVVVATNAGGGNITGNLQGGGGPARARGPLGAGDQQTPLDEGGGQPRDRPRRDADQAHDLRARQAPVAQQGEDDRPLGPAQLRPRGGGGHRAPACGRRVLGGHGAIMPS